MFVCKKILKFIWTESCFLKLTMNQFDRTFTGTWSFLSSFATSSCIKLVHAKLVFECWKENENNCLMRETQSLPLICNENTEKAKKYLFNLKIIYLEIDAFNNDWMQTTMFRYNIKKDLKEFCMIVSWFDSAGINFKLKGFAFLS